MARHGGSRGPGRRTLRCGRGGSRGRELGQRSGCPAGGAAEHPEQVTPVVDPSAIQLQLFETDEVAEVSDERSDDQ